MADDKPNNSRVREIFEKIDYYVTIVHRITGTYLDIREQLAKPNEDNQSFELNSNTGGPGTVTED